jgi:hypothetical protein
MDTTRVWAAKNLCGLLPLRDIVGWITGAECQRDS